MIQDIQDIWKRAAESIAHANSEWLKKSMKPESGIPLEIQEPEDLLHLANHVTYLCFEQVRDEGEAKEGVIGHGPVAEYDLEVFLKKSYSPTQVADFLSKRKALKKVDKCAKYAVGPVRQFAAKRRISSVQFSAHLLRKEIMDLRNDLFLGKDAWDIDDWVREKGHEYRSFQIERGLPSSLVRLGNSIAHILACGTCRCQDVYPNKLRCPTGHFLSLENLDRAQRAEKPFKTSFDTNGFVRRAVVEGTFSLVQASKAKHLFCVLFELPDGCAIRVARFGKGYTVSINGLRCVGHGGDDDTIEEEVVDTPIDPFQQTIRLVACSTCRTVLCARDTEEEFEKLIHEHRKCALVASSQLAGEFTDGKFAELRLKRCQSGHFWLGKVKCPVCGALPITNSTGTRSAVKPLSIFVPDELDYNDIRDWSLVLQDAQ